MPDGLLPHSYVKFVFMTVGYFTESFIYVHFMFMNVTHIHAYVINGNISMMISCVQNELM